MQSGEIVATRRLTLVLPAFNEASTILEVLQRVRKILPESPLVIVDDGSSDGTGEQITSFADGNLTLVSFERNRGKGAALRTGASFVRTEFFGYLDADLDLHPEAIVRGLQLLESQEDLVAVFGSKMHEESFVVYPTVRKYWSMAFNFLLRILFGVKVSDTQTGLKVFRSSSVIPLIDGLTSDGWTLDLELLLKILQQGGQVTEMPVKLEYDFTSSIRFLDGMEAVRDVLKLWANSLLRKPRIGRAGIRKKTVN